MVKGAVTVMHKKLVTDYLDAIVEKYPDKVGFEDERKSLTFSKFRDDSCAVATAILRKDYSKKPVAVYLDKSVDCLVGTFGTIYSTNFYTILDTQMPMARVSKICDVLRPVIIITDSKHVAELDGINTEKLLIDEVDFSDIDLDLITSYNKTAIDTDVVYTLFTSGSTGNPKGVIISHRNIITYMEWSFEAFHFSTETVFGSQTPFYFSMSVLDIYQTIRCAGKLIVIPKALFTFPMKLIPYLKEKGINTIYWVPSAICQVANMGALSCPELSTLHTVLFAGEVMPTKQLNMWRKALPNAMFANLFGPTEVTDICTYYILGRELRDTESVPIGDVCDNMNVFIINDQGKECKVLETGEMYVRGASVAYGYYNNPEKTAEAFVQNPLNTAYPETVYKTGDLVYRNEAGEIIYISRKDFQIKHMGYRIELGEIEVAVSSVEGIERACCVYDKQNSHIILFFTGTIEQFDLKKNLRRLLPKYMLPNIYNKLEQMPLNLNGKIDRNGLLKSIEENE